MRQAALGIVHKQNTDVVGAVGFQCLRRGIRIVPHLIGHTQDIRPGLFTDIRVMIEGFADRRYGNAARGRNILQ